MKFWESTETPSPKVGVALGVWRFTPSHFSTLPGVCAVTPMLSLGPQPCNPFCFGHKPKAKVATFAIYWWCENIRSNFFLKAFQGKALHKEAKVNHEMMELELQKVLLDVEALSKKRTTSDLHYVRWRHDKVVCASNHYPLYI